MAESGTLLRCYTRKGIEGSNPSLSAMKKNFIIISIALAAFVLIQCEDASGEGDNIVEVSAKFDMRLPIDSNGYYHLTLKKDENSWQTTHRVDGVVTDEFGPSFYQRVTWESNLYWYLGDTLGYVVKKALSDDVVYVSYDTIYITGFNGMEVPTTNGVSYSNEDGEISNMIAPVKSMEGDTLLLTAYWKDYIENSFREPDCCEHSATFGIVLD